MRDDIRTAFRSLASSRTFTVVALAVLTLGIGASTAIFSVVDAVVLRGLPFDEHDRLVAVGERRPVNRDFPDATRDPQALSSAAPQNYMDWAARQQVFETMAAIANGMFVVILAESAAKTLFPGDSAIGQSINIGRDSSQTVVGVVGDVYQRNLETEPRTEAYLPMAQQRTFFAELLIKTSGDPALAVPAIKTAAAAAMPGVLLRNIQTMDHVLSRLMAQRRRNMLLLGLFGLLGLVISAVGVYGVMAYAVSQRTREIGVRMALGATRIRVLSMILQNALILVVSGMIVGGGAAWMLRGTADGFLFRMEVNDPRAFAAALGTLAAAAVVASLIPARRAASVDPTVALRAE